MTGTFFILAHPFLTLAFGAGTAIALMTGLVGYQIGRASCRERVCNGV